jgi:hypothetical protein
MSTNGVTESLLVICSTLGMSCTHFLLDSITAACHTHNENEATITMVVDVLARWPAAYSGGPVQYHLLSESLSTQKSYEMRLYDINHTSYDIKKQYFTANTA